MIDVFVSRSGETPTKSKQIVWNHSEIASTSVECMWHSMKDKSISKRTKVYSYADFAIDPMWNSMTAKTNWKRITSKVNPIQHQSKATSLQHFFVDAQCSRGESLHFWFLKLRWDFYEIKTKSNETVLKLHLHQSKTCEIQWRPNQFHGESKFTPIQVNSVWNRINVNENHIKSKSRPHQNQIKSKSILHVWKFDEDEHCVHIFCQVLV